MLGCGEMHDSHLAAAIIAQNFHVFWPLAVYERLLRYKTPAAAIMIILPKPSMAFNRRSMRRSPKNVSA